MLRIVYYPEQIRPGVSVMRRDVILDGELVMSEIDGSPAPTVTVAAYARSYTS